MHGRRSLASLQIGANNICAFHDIADLLKGVPLCY